MLAAARRLPDLGITHRRTTISTVGWMPGLKRFVDEVEEPIRLALSLHAPDDALRSQIMPVNDRYPLADVLAECRRYVELRRRKVFVEYVMLAGVNDRVEQARAARGAARAARLFKVNLIPYNPTGLLRGLVAERDRRVQGRARPRGAPGDGAAHARARHRRGVRPAGRRAATQLRGPEPGKHREVPNVRRQQLRAELERSRRNEVVRVLDADVRRAMSYRERGSESGDRLVDRHPAEP